MLAGCEARVRFFVVWMPNEEQRQVLGEESERSRGANSRENGVAVLFALELCVYEILGTVGVFQGGAHLPPVSQRQIWWAKIVILAAHSCESAKTHRGNPDDEAGSLRQIERDRWTECAGTRYTGGEVWEGDTSPSQSLPIGPTGLRESGCFPERMKSLPMGGVHPVRVFIPTEEFAGGYMEKNPFQLRLAGKADQQPVVVLDDVRNGLIAHMRLDVCEACGPGYQALSPRVHALEEERVVLLGRVQALYEEINAYTRQVVELMREEKAQLCKPCWARLTHLNDVVTFVQECDLQSPLKPFTALLVEEKGNENADVKNLVPSEDVTGGS